jgi:hypothetical protein
MTTFAKTRRVHHSVHKSTPLAAITNMLRAYVAMFVASRTLPAGLGLAARAPSVYCDNTDHGVYKMAVLIGGEECEAATHQKWLCW